MCKVLGSNEQERRPHLTELTILGKRGGHTTNRKDKLLYTRREREEVRGTISEWPKERCEWKILRDGFGLGGECARNLSYPKMEWF